MVRRLSHHQRVAVETEHQVCGRHSISTQHFPPDYLCWLSSGPENPDPWTSESCDINSFLPTLPHPKRVVNWKHWILPPATAPLQLHWQVELRALSPDLSHVSFTTSPPTHSSDMLYGCASTKTRRPRSLSSISASAEYGTLFILPTLWYIWRPLYVGCLQLLRKQIGSLVRQVRTYPVCRL